MVAKPYLATESTDVVTPWPQEYGFSLADVAKQSRWINGSAAAFVWNAINKSLGDPLISDHGQTYLVDLELTSISEYDQVFGC